MSEEKEVYEKLAECSVSISNLGELIVQAGELPSKLPSLWASSDLQEQETLQKLVHPSGLAYDKKKQAFRTIKINEAFSQIACLSSDLDKMTKGLNTKKSIQSLLAEREGFEPSIPCGIHAFQACQFSHSCTSPQKSAQRNG